MMRPFTPFADRELPPAILTRRGLPAGWTYRQLECDVDALLRDAARAWLSAVGCNRKRRRQVALRDAHGYAGHAARLLRDLAAYPREEETR